MSTILAFYQTIYSDSVLLTLTDGNSFHLPIYYDASDPELSGLTLNIHFDSALLEVQSFESSISPAINTAGIFEDTQDLDRDSLTDKYVQFVWATFNNTFPNISIPGQIADLTFAGTGSNSNPSRPLSTSIRFTVSETAVGYEFLSDDITVQFNGGSTVADTGAGVAGSVLSSNPGNFQEGVTLTAPAVTGDPDGDAQDPNYTHQWFFNDNAITGATSSTYATTATGAGIYRVAITYTDAQGFTATVDSPEQIVAKIVTAPTTLTGTAITIDNLAYPETVATLNGSPDFVNIEEPVSVTLKAVSKEEWGERYVAQNQGGTNQPGTNQKIALRNLGKYSFVATAIPEATTAINLEPSKNTAFFLHDAYSAFYEGLTLSSDSSGRQSHQRLLHIDTIQMGSAGGTSIVDLTSKDYITGAATVKGADKGRSIFWGTDSDDTFISGGGDSVIFGGAGSNTALLGAGRDTLQYRSGVNASDQIHGFDPTKDVIELWVGASEIQTEPQFSSSNGSSIMTWGSNTLQFLDVSGLSLSNLQIINRVA